ncbi:disease resistance protein TAO1-like isoform X2 [Raphanus sativus]|nr:disease resistance protein TAO1-like isoform X2 [Raphanus sativus]XP_056848327.1 disease resistance protein TAO1-like isoform X2 [Raphanus sativus]XP_056848328.1 disease resistance protein TAO1-like isoform X2 [Raphanus sativus]XP_056848329.1 disease resistance protein TAO1-like isoform X2 [Raphanus sativus]XP_056848330.1 disease resistance protein TAO1-like isoform X2 [Raphanus sativus]XP_056848678.1 disease resistance protein TAO1-like isoform X2 [Raphanus sativus]XP_056848679.1 disease 
MASSTNDFIRKSRSRQKIGSIASSTIFFIRESSCHQENETMASSSSTLSDPQSSLSHSWKHHVFPSFHGADVRENFLSHIVKEFKSKAIDLFIDNDIERSKSIGPELIEAIRGSRIAIVFVSKNGSSTWCLNELVEIMHFREEFGQTVMSIFYQVDPTDVKKQTGYFGKVFEKTCEGKTEEDIRRWKHALAEVAQIAGFHSTNWKNEAEMIEDIVTDVSNKLNLSAPSNDFGGLVGMESHMADLTPLMLQLDSHEVLKIGIWGPPGIGKTTIARYLFNRYSRYVDLSVFMDNIKTKYAKKTACSDDYSVKLDLQKQFMSQLTNEKDIKNFSHLGIAKDRLKDKSLLVILDDVDRPVQVEAVAKENSWFGQGSMIIVITQDLKVLKSCGIDHIHKVNLPSNEEALQIFCMHAFGQRDPKDGFIELACEVVSLVENLPLGLRVMGSYFRGMSEQDWTEALPRLRTHIDRDGEISSILISYDSLCDEDKLLVLHIACFFNGESVEACLAKRFVDVTHGLRVLAEKSLISMEWGKIKMAELLVQLVRKTVRGQSVSEPGKRQFLNDAIDIEEVLSDYKADSSSVIGINDETYGDITCTSKRAFERLYNLQFLRINSLGVNPQSMNHISQKLRVLIWHEFQMPCFPSSFNPKFLVKLEMPNSTLEKLWKKTQLLSNLKRMDLSYSRRLKELPDLSTATNLYDLDLSYCSNLVKLPSSIGNAINLNNLDLRFCSSLVEIPSSIGNAVNLEIFILYECSSLVKIPSSIITIASLTPLTLHGCSSLVELPLNIETVTEPNHINLSRCSSLVKLPSSIGNATKLEELNLSYCSSLVELPFSIGNAINLRKLDFTFCLSLVELPSSIGNATKLEEMDFSHCSNLLELPFSIGNAINLRILNLSRCSSLVKLLSSIGNLTNLEELDLSYCSSLVELPSSIENAIDLQILNLSHCSSLVDVPFCIGSIINLETLNFENCSSLVKLPSLIRNAVSLQEWELRDYSRLIELPSSIQTVNNLRELTLSDCSSMVELPSIMRNVGRFLKCLKLEVLLDDINLESLEVLSFSECYLLESYPESPTDIQELDPWMGRISRLTRLVLSGMKNLVSLPPLPDSLFVLEAENCESLERLGSSFRNPYMMLNFRNCFKLNQEARDIISRTWTSAYAVFPGRKVPQCFTYRSSGSSVTVKLNQLALGISTKFKACILCADSDGVNFPHLSQASVCCSITSGENALTGCYKNVGRVSSGHLYTFRVELETDEVTSPELVFEFKIQFGNINSETWEIKECGILQLLEVPHPDNHY